MAWYQNAKGMVIAPTSATYVVDETPFDMENDNIGVALCDGTAQTLTDTNFDDVSAQEIAATGYVALGDGINLGSVAISVQSSPDRAELDAADHEYTAIGGALDDTFSSIIIFRRLVTTPTAANSKLIAHATTAATTTNGGNITLQWDDEGILHIT